jgi:hypothetical protein
MIYEFKFKILNHYVTSAFKLKKKSGLYIMNKIIKSATKKIKVIGFPFATSS